MIADVLAQGVTVHGDGSTSFSWIGTVLWVLIPVLFLGAIFAYDPIMDFLHGGHDKRFPPKGGQEETERPAHEERKHGEGRDSQVG